MSCTGQYVDDFKPSPFGDGWTTAIYDDEVIHRHGFEVPWVSEYPFVEGFFLTKLIPTNEGTTEILAGPFESISAVKAFLRLTQ